MSKLLSLWRATIKGKLDLCEGAGGFSPAPDDPEGVTVLPGHVAAAKSMRAPHLLSTTKYRDRVASVQRAGAHPALVEFFIKYQRAMERVQVPVFATEFVRSDLRQAELKKNGHSRAGPGQSPHNFGLAVDIVHAERPWRLTKEEYEVVGAIGKEVARRMGLRIVWGGDWSFFDPVHWQIEHWKSYREVMRRRPDFIGYEPKWHAIEAQMIADGKKNHRALK